MAGGTVRTIEVPLFLGGREKRGDDVSIDAVGTDGPVRVLLPEITAAEIDALGQGRRQLADLGLEEILSFLDEVKARWADEASPLRREALGSR